MPDAPARRRRLTVAVAGAALAACAVVGSFVFLDFRGPRPSSAPAPEVQLQISGAHGPVTPGATLSRGTSLSATVTLPRAAQVSLVHLDLGHGMEPLVLNVHLEAGTHPLLRNGAPLALPLDDLSGPQVLAAVASERELIADEALTAARGVAVRGTLVSRFEFSVAP